MPHGSLGSGPPSGWKRERHEVPLPKSRPELVKAFAAILEQGNVQMVHVQLGQPLLFERLVEAVNEPDGEAPELEETPNLLAACRNAPMAELQERTGDLDNPYYVLFRAFEQLSMKQLTPVALLVRDHETVREWLRLGDNHLVEELFGVTVEPVLGMPKDVALLAARSPASVDPHSVALSVRLSLDVEVGEEDEEHAQEGTAPEEGVDPS